MVPVPGAEDGTKDDNANYDYSSVPMAGLPMIGAILGMCLGGPVGILAGVKIGGLAAVGGSILGYTGASVVSEHKELREYIDEHYEKEPELYVQSPREEALAKRRTSRSLPEVPGAGGRAIPSAKHRTGPNGYRRPSLVRASSFESRGADIRLHRGGHEQGRVGSGYSGRGLSREGGTGRKLPSRPSFSRTQYSIEQGGWHSRASNPGARRHPLLRHNSNLHRKMSYRQSNNNLEGYGRQQGQGYRRYYSTGGEGGYQEGGRSEAWSVADFQRAASVEDRSYVVQERSRRLMVRQQSVNGGSCGDLNG